MVLSTTHSRNLRLMTLSISVIMSLSSCNSGSSQQQSSMPSSKNQQTLITTPDDCQSETFIKGEIKLSGGTNLFNFGFVSIEEAPIKVHECRNKSGDFCLDIGDNKNKLLIHIIKGAILNFDILKAIAENKQYASFTACGSPIVNHEDSIISMKISPDDHTWFAVSEDYLAAGSY